MDFDKAMNNVIYSRINHLFKRKRLSIKPFFIIHIVCSVLLIFGCKEDYTPKPYGYYRIDFPEKSYKLLTGKFPYHFEIAGQASIEEDCDNDAEPYWINIVYPMYNAKIHLSYKKITSDTSLPYYQQDCHRMAYSHTIKAESIDERLFQQGNGVFGLLYFIEGNTASSTQFYMTDSTKNFLRGALYFNERPNKDSLAPVVHYLRQDVIRIMETIKFDHDK